MCATSFNIAKGLKNLGKITKYRSFGWTDDIGSWKYLLMYVFEKNWLYIIENVFTWTQDKFYLYLFTSCFSGNISLWNGSISDNKTFLVWLLRWRTAKIYLYWRKRLKIGSVQRIENFVSKYFVNKYLTWIA